MWFLHVYFSGCAAGKSETRRSKGGAGRCMIVKAPKVLPSLGGT